MNICMMGYELPDTGPCPKCGATEEESCKARQPKHSSESTLTITVPVTLEVDFDYQAEESAIGLYPGCDESASINDIRLVPTEKDKREIEEALYSKIAQVRKESAEEAA